MRLILILLLSFLLQTSLYSKNEKNVLILNSYHYGFELSDRIIKNIKNTFDNNHKINTNILYMDSKQIYSRDYIKELSDLYTLQLKDRSYDLIIAIDSFAYLFALKNYQILFHNEPMLFTGMEEYSKELVRIYNLDNKINGILERLPIRENIDLILKMMPELKTLYILNDRSPKGDDSSPFITKALKDIRSKVKVQYLRDDTLEEITKYFSTYKENEAILFIRYSNNNDGSYYKQTQLTSALDKFKLPIFVTNNLLLTKNVIGGKITSIEKLAEKTAHTALNILDKRNKNISIETLNNESYIFDYKQLKKYSLTIPKDIKNYKLINAPISFFDKHRTLINSVFLATPILLVVIFGLLQALYSKQQSSRFLKQRVEFDKILLNSLESPIFWQNHNGKILDSNKKFCELMQVSYTILQGSILDRFYHHNYNAHKIIKALENFDNHKLEDSQLFLKNYKGEKLIYLISRTSYIDPKSNQKATVTQFTDITKEKEIEQERVRNTQYMIQQSKLVEIGEIFSSIAHQWKSPLVEITALAQDLFYSQDRTEKEEDSYHINNIMVQVKYMTKTINDFQNFISPSKEKTYFDIEQTIYSMLEIVKHNMKYNYVDIKINIEKGTPLKVYGYENEFMQAILNIINNAKDALLNNNEKNRFIFVDIKKRATNLIIDISDNGPGIDKETVNKIFLQYYTTKQSGHGIGLYMTKLIIEDKMNGKIRYKHKENGSCFRIKLRQNYENTST